MLDAARECDAFALVATAIYTGLRLGKLVALEWPDVDLGDGRRGDSTHPARIMRAARQA